MFRVITLSAITAIGGVLLGTATDVRAQGVVASSGDAIAVPSGDCGSNNASVNDFESTAVGCNAKAGNQRATAVGFGAEANVGEGVGAATAIGTFADAKGQDSIAVGRDARTRGNEAIAIGGRKDNVPNNVAKTTAAEQGISIGSGTQTGIRGVAVGTESEAFEDATAIGDQTRALGDGSVVIGTNSDSDPNSTNRDNHVLLGMKEHTYTLPGITSQESKNLQSGPLEVVTTDQDGNLASMSMSQIASQQQVEQNTDDIADNRDDIDTNTDDIADNRDDIDANTDDIAENRDDIGTNTAGIAGNRDDIAANAADIADNRDDIDTNTQGVAIAIAMEGPDLAGNETFALAANWGTFEGVNAFAASATGVLSRDVFADGSGVRLSASGGIGFSPSQDGADDSVAGRAGVQLSW